VKIAPGIRETATGYQAYVRVHGRFRSKNFPRDTPLSKLKDWRERTRAHEKYGTGPAADAPTFRQDAKEYLTHAAGMPSLADRTYHIEQWIDAFGDRPRQTITARDIRAQLERWRTTGRIDGGPLTAGSLNRRRTALMALYTVLDGRSAPNIVKDVPAYDESASATIRALPRAIVARLIWHIRRGSRTRARLRVLLWTGWPHALLMAITPADVDWNSGTVRVPPRQKGKGMQAATIPVLPRALLALRRFFALNAQGRFSASAMHSSLARAVAKENRWRIRHKLPPLKAVRPYDIRHSVGTWMAARVKDDRALKELLRTNSIARYTQGATDDRLMAARQVLTGKVAQQLSAGTPGDSRALRAEASKTATRR
jgi:integrase